MEILENQTPPIYCNIEDAITRCLWKSGWKIGEIIKEDKIKLKNFLRKNLIKKDNKTITNPHNKPRWALLWWEKN